MHSSKLTKQAFLKKVIDQFTLLESNEELLMDTPFKQLKAYDSMTALLIISMIEDDFGVALNGDDMTKINTIEELYQLVESNQK